MREIVIATLRAIGWYFLAIAICQIFERSIPAERGQPARNLLFSAACTTIILLAQPLVGMASLWMTSALRPALISLDLMRPVRGLA